MPSLDTLVSDIQNLFTGKEHTCDPDRLQRLGRSISEKVAERLTERRDRGFSLRLSQIGKPDRQVWQDAHGDHPTEPLRADALVKFLFGDILEELLWFLAEEAGHEVTDRQKEVSVDGVLGHIDGKIDGVVVDTKSSSTYGFKKFTDGSLSRNDDFGYMWQLAGYTTAEGQDEGAFLVIDKTLGHIVLDTHKKEELQHYDVPRRISDLREVLDRPDPPDHCYDPVPDGKSGNKKLDTGCSYCKHKFACWPGLRTFIYSTGPRYLTKVVKTPDVPEINKEEEQDIE